MVEFVVMKQKNVFRQYVSKSADDWAFWMGGFNSIEVGFATNILSMVDIPLISWGWMLPYLPSWFRTVTFFDMLTKMGFCTSTLWTRWNSGNQTLVLARPWSLIALAFHIDVYWCFFSQNMCDFLWFAHLKFMGWPNVRSPDLRTFSFDIKVNQLSIPMFACRRKLVKG